MKKIRIGTRGSQLALWQAEFVKKLLQEKNPKLDFEIVIIKTKGDKILDTPLAKIGDKGLFTKELEISLLEKETDIAVHSMKDLPTAIDERLKISAVPEREITNDLFISNKFKTFAELPAGAVIGTSSLRRKAQLSFLRNDLVFNDLRGNVNTRLAKLDQGLYDAIILAFAGIKRLGFNERMQEIIDFSVCLPATGQGAIAVQSRTADQETNQIMKTINHWQTELCIRIERAFLAELQGGCQIPIGCQAWFAGEILHLSGLVAGIDGKDVIKDELCVEFLQTTAITPKVIDFDGLEIEELSLKLKNAILEKKELAETLGKELAQRLIAKGAIDLIKLN